MFVVADARGRIGGTLRVSLPLSSIGPVVLPGRAAELEGWIERLALQGPVWDCTGGSKGGIAVILVDEGDAMAVARIPAASDGPIRTF